MCFGGNDSSPTPQLPSPPPEQEMLDVIDEVNGVQSIVATDAVTGKKRRMIQKLPRSPEDQALFDEAGILMTRAIEESQRLYSYDPSQILDFAPFVTEINRLNTERQGDLASLAQIPDFAQEMNQFKGMQQTILDDAYARQQNTQQEALNRMGYGHGSTASGELNAVLASEKAKADQRVGVESELYGRDLRRQDMADRSNLYGLREAGRQGQLSSLQSDYGFQKDHQRDLENQRELALSHNQNLLNIGSAIRGADTAQRASSMAPQLQFADWQARNNMAMQRHQAETNRILGQHQLNRGDEANRQPGFGSTMLGLGGTVVGAYFGGPMGAMAGGAAGRAAGGAMDRR